MALGLGLGILDTALYLNQYRLPFVSTTSTDTIPNFNTLRCAVIYSKMSAYGTKYPCLTNQERPERAVCQKFIFVQKNVCGLLPFLVFQCHATL